MKKTILIFAICLLLGAAPLALAQQSGFVPLAPIPGLTDNVADGPAGLADFFNNLYKFLIGLAAALAVIQIIWAGLDIAIFHKDAVSAITEDKGKIRDALFGLILVLSPALVFSIINPSILNLSLNMPPLDTNFGFTASEVKGPSTCKIEKSGVYLETASCPNKNEALKYRCKNGGTVNIPGACAADNPLGGECQDGTAVTISCEKSVDVTYQVIESSLLSYAPGISGAQKLVNDLLNLGKVTPNDVQKEAAFSSGCNAEGGKVDKDTNLSSYYTASKCPGADTTATFTYKCYKVTLTCEAN